MARKGQIADGDNVLDFLNTENQQDNSPIPDPIVDSRIRVTIDLLKPYGNNPRITVNPRYDEILASIEARGLDHTPNITRQYPEDKHYIIKDGGNTRLTILHELYNKYIELKVQAKTQDEERGFAEKAESFYIIECTFKPWVSESDALAGHMSENEERGDTKFIEKAISVKKFRELYAEEDKQSLIESGEDIDEDYISPRLSIRALSERITKQGWSISHTHLTRFEYATDVLIDVIPKALWAGAGFPLTIKIRKYEKAYTEFSKNLEENIQNDISSNYFEKLKTFDAKKIDFDAFISNFNEYLANDLDMATVTVSAEISALINNKGITVPQELINQNAASPEAVASHYKDTRNPGETVKDPGPVKSSSKKKSSDSKAASPVNNSGDVDMGAFIVPNSLSICWDEIFNRISYFAQTYDFMITVFEQNNCYQYNVLDCHPFSAEKEDLPRIPLVFENTIDDERAAMWWVLTHLSCSYRAYPIQEFIDGPFATVYQSYLHALEHNIMSMILFLEEKVVMLPNETQILMHELRLLTKQYLTLQDGVSND